MWLGMFLLAALKACNCQGNYSGYMGTESIDVPQLSALEACNDIGSLLSVGRCIGLVAPALMMSPLIVTSLRSPTRCFSTIVMMMSLGLSILSHGSSLCMELPLLSHVSLMYRHCIDDRNHMRVVNGDDMIQNIRMWLFLELPSPVGLIDTHSRGKARKSCQLGCVPSDCHVILLKQNGLLPQC